eukprot:GHVU01197237.1.p1 GENE.GHVU01197237.1~~GHVU01197237.1.p1  ORF type:complete len:154 (-),score=12.09 GHVU01197237.1:271-675(-)
MSLEVILSGFLLLGLEGRIADTSAHNYNVNADQCWYDEAAQPLPPIPVPCASWGSFGGNGEQQFLAYNYNNTIVEDQTPSSSSCRGCNAPLPQPFQSVPPQQRVSANSPAECSCSSNRQSTNNRMRWSSEMHEV